MNCERINEATMITTVVPKFVILSKVTAEIILRRDSHDEEAQAGRGKPIKCVIVC
jgi:hypothetical protein